MIPLLTSSSLVQRRKDSKWKQRQRARLHKLSAAAAVELILAMMTYRRG